MAYQKNIAELMVAIERAGIKMDHILSASTNYGLLPASILMETDGLLEVTRKLELIVNGHTVYEDGLPRHIIFSANIDGIEIKSIDFYPREKI